MISHFGQLARTFLCLVFVGIIAACSTPQPSGAAPYASIVQDARTGEVLYETNSQTRLHPASLTKMMTLYIAFQEIERGNISPDTMVKISKHAAAQPPSKLGLKAGQRIALRHLIRAAAIKSANDAATAIGEAIAGDEPRFAALMTQTAQALGMTGTTFKNANGLTAKGHLSTAADMNLLGRRLFFDFPQYYNIFSRRTSDAGIAEVRNTNTRFLDAYKGADGIKTGYTIAAGFNLTASAERGGVRIISTIFGGTSTAQRNAKMAELMDIGFRRAPESAPVLPPPPAAYVGIPPDGLPLASSEDMGEQGVGAKTIRLAGAVATSPRPLARPSPEKVAAAAQAVTEMGGSIDAALAEAFEEPAPAGTLQAQAQELAQELPQESLGQAEPAELAGLAAPDGIAEPAGDPATEADPALAMAEDTTEPDAIDESLPVLAAPQDQAPDGLDAAADAPVMLAALAPAPQGEQAQPLRRAPIFDPVPTAATVEEEEPVVIRLSTSNARQFGVNLGNFTTRGEAERLLLKTQLVESATLNTGLRKIVQSNGGFDATFMGLTEEQADLACRRLQARGTTCFMMVP